MRIAFDLRRGLPIVSSADLQAAFGEVQDMLSGGAVLFDAGHQWRRGGSAERDAGGVDQLARLIEGLALRPDQTHVVYGAHPATPARPTRHVAWRFKCRGRNWLSLRVRLFADNASGALLGDVARAGLLLTLLAASLGRRPRKLELQVWSTDDDRPLISPAAFVRLSIDERWQRRGLAGLLAMPWSAVKSVGLAAVAQ